MNSLHHFWQFTLEHYPELITKLFEQCYLVAVAMFIALSVGIPLGILITKYKALRQPILLTANLLQTVPSLALLVFLLPFFGIGVLPAVITLGIYALLPIVRNTYTGLSTLSPTLMESCRGLGFNSHQQLRWVEFPLALPVIVAGIRTSTAMCVGISTLAAFIGAGGLGEFINRGLAVNNQELVLLGAIPAAFLALTLDFIIGKLEKKLQPHKKRYKPKGNSLTWILSTSCAVVITGAFIAQGWPSKNTLTIGSKNFTESIILSEMMAQMIEAHTQLTVQRKFNLGTTQIAHRAITQGQIDLYPEYTGTGYLVVLKQSATGLSPTQLFQSVKHLYTQQFHLTWLQPFGFNNSNAFMIDREVATSLRIDTIEDLRPYAAQLTIGVLPEAWQRPDALPGLLKNYHLQFSQISQLNTGLLFPALYHKQVDLILAFSTDGQLDSKKAKVLKDPKHTLPSYYAAPVIREDTLAAHPEIRKALAPLGGIMDENAIRQLNHQASEHKKSIEAIVAAYLKGKGLV